MRPTRPMTVFLLGALLLTLGLLPRFALLPAPAQAQGAGAKEAGRYQIIASDHMLYFLDTKTGQLWRHNPGDLGREGRPRWSPYPSPVTQER